MRKIAPLFAALLLFATPARAATLIGSFSGLNASNYTDIWKVANATPQPLILNDLSGDDDLRGLYVGNVMASGCELYVTPEWGDPAGANEFVAVGSIVTINNVPVGVALVDLSPLRCLVAYNFNAFGPIEGESTPEEPEEPEVPDEPQPPVEPACEDSDGGYDIYTQGTMTQGTQVQTEYCLNEQMVMEYSCGGTTWTTGQAIAWACDYGCVSGRCLTPAPGPDAEEETEPAAIIASCVDSDGGLAPHTQGFLTLIANETENTSEGEELTQQDACLNDDELTEYYCDDRATQLFGSQFVDCPGSCSNGVCVSNFCEETDNGIDRFVGGTMTHDRALLVNPAVDHCVGSMKLVEYACGYNLYDTDPTNDYTQMSICPLGCVVDAQGEGQCQTITQAFSQIRMPRIVSVWLSRLFGLFGGN